jgi:hypothetical protein
MERKPVPNKRNSRTQLPDPYWVSLFRMWPWLFFLAYLLHLRVAALRVMGVLEKLVHFTDVRSVTKRLVGLLVSAEPFERCRLDCRADGYI